MDDNRIFGNLTEFYLQMPDRGFVDAYLPGFAARLNRVFGVGRMIYVPAMFPRRSKYRLQFGAFSLYSRPIPFPQTQRADGRSEQVKMSQSDRYIKRVIDENNSYEVETEKFRISFDSN